jgi:hypothetical protein
MRDIITAVSPAHADLILAAQESGATDDDLHELVARPSPTPISEEREAAARACTSNSRT